MIDTKRLRHVLALEQHRNFRRAARALHITQPALTRSIKLLEQEVGARLFDRGPHGVEPTDIGLLFIAHARRLDIYQDDLVREIQLAKGLESGTLKVGVGPYAAASMIGPVLGRLASEHPKLRTKIVVAPWDELPARVRAREIDLMLVDMRGVESQGEFEVTPLRDHPAFMVCRAGHPLLDLKEISWSDVFRYPLVGPRIPEKDLEVVRERMPAGMRRAVKQSQLLAVRCDGAPILKSIVEHSDALSLQSVFMMEEELESGRLVILPGIDFGIRAVLCVAHLSHRTPSVPAARLLEMIQEYDEQLLAREQALLKRLAMRRP